MGDVASATRCTVWCVEVLFAESVASQCSFPSQSSFFGGGEQLPVLLLCPPHQLPVTHHHITLATTPCIAHPPLSDTVIYARDKWLAPGGTVLPDRCTLSLCAIEDGQYRSEKIDFWDNV